MEDESRSLEDKLSDLTISLKLSKQFNLAQNSRERLGELNELFDKYMGKPLSKAAHAAWNCSERNIASNKYGLSTDDLQSVADQLLDSRSVGIRMAGLMLAVDEMYSELARTSSGRLKELRALLGDPVEPDHPELVEMISVVDQFRVKVKLAKKATISDAESKICKATLNALKGVKVIAARRDLKRWRGDYFNSLANSYEKEINELIDEDNFDNDLDEGIYQVFKGAKDLGNMQLPAGADVIEMISFFSFGMGLKLAERRRIFGDKDWTVCNAIASVSTSLMRRGVGEDRLTYYRLRLLPLVFVSESYEIDDEKINWIQAGMNSMDRSCRSNDEFFAEDFQNHLYISLS